MPQTLTTPRLLLERLRPDHAEEMALVLDDERLHTFVGGSPSTVAGLRAQYRAVSELRSDDTDASWPSWIVRRRDDGKAIGSVDATLDGIEAHVAWVIGVASQGQGFATEAARAVVAWLEGNGITDIQAAIRLDHTASAAVAARAGLLPTGREIDGDRIWRKRSVAGLAPT